MADRVKIPVKPKQTPLDIIKRFRNEARSGRFRDVVPEKVVRMKGRFPTPERDKKTPGVVFVSPTFYVADMFAGRGARLIQTAPGGPYVGPFRFRPNKMGGYARRDED